LTISQITEQRKLKKGTIWQHIAILIEHHELRLRDVLPQNKIKKILRNIHTPDDTLLGIKTRLSDSDITYNEIAVVLANIQGKKKKKSIAYYIAWYRRTNCYRKCYGNKKQREACKRQFQKLTAKIDITYTKKEFLCFVNKHTTICRLPKQQKEIHLTWHKFNQHKNMKCQKSSDFRYI
jgi:hypothetical protein